MNNAWFLVKNTGRRDFSAGLSDPTVRYALDIERLDNETAHYHLNQKTPDLMAPDFETRDLRSEMLVQAESLEAALDLAKFAALDQEAHHYSIYDVHGEERPGLPGIVEGPGRPHDDEWARLITLEAA